MKISALGSGQLPTPRPIAASVCVLIPQFVFLGLGVAWASFYLVRLARGPHVTLWDKKNNPEPWAKLDPTYQYKFVAINTDYKKLKKQGPDF